jgi:ATP/ADP translocase
MSTFLWIVLAALYLTALIVLGVSTLRKGHWFMFIIGIFMPLFWIIGALIPPTGAARAA